jgi:hypothetical protein
MEASFKANFLVQLDKVELSKAKAYNFMINQINLNYFSVNKLKHHFY